MAVLNPSNLHRYLSAREVADLLRIKVGTLRRWRWQRRGPKDWFHVSATHVIYPDARVQEFLNEAEARSKERGAERSNRCH